MKDQETFNQAYKIISNKIDIYTNSGERFRLCENECDMQNLIHNNKKTNFTIPTVVNGVSVTQNHLSYKTI